MHLPEPAAIEARLGSLDRVLDRLGIDRVTGAVLTLVSVGLLARLLNLGSRLAHFDEGRVAYWILHFMDTGEFHYRFIIHGPLVQHANTAVFAVFGTNDFTMRLLVALIGALVPLALLWLREHLTDAEIIGAATFLTFNPILLYYSRFFRSTIPVAAFSFAAFATAVRFYDTRRPRYLHGAVAFFALAFAAKENAVIYLVVFIGAGALLLDTELFRPRAAATGVEKLRAWGRDSLRDRNVGRFIGRIAGHTILALVLFGAITLFFYAPRAGTPNGTGLYNSLGDPGQLPAVIDATLADLQTGFDYWFGSSTETGNDVPLVEQYGNYLEQTLSVLSTYAAPLLAFAGIGAIAERYASTRPRHLVQFATYWGVVSIIGYPLGADIFGAWIAVNMLVPLAIPAGVGVAILYRWAKDAYLADDELSLGIVALLVFFVVAQVAGAGVGAVYANPTGADNDLVQYAQPGDPALRGTLGAIDEVVEEADGSSPAVLFYGETLIDRNDEAIQPDCADISTTLPLQWYLTRSGATGDCAQGTASFDSQFGDDPPPVIITTPENADDIEERVPGYERRTHLLRTSIERLVFFIDTDRVTGAATQ